MTCGIYKITSPSGRVYVGHSVNIERRWAEYRRPGGPKKQRRLYRSLVAHGVAAHEFTVLEECSETELLSRERRWQEALSVTGRSGLNCRLAEATDRSGRWSAESLGRLRAAQGGERNPNFGKRGAETSCWGRKRPEAEREAIRAYQATRGRIIQQIDPISGVVLREARARDYAAEGLSQGNISSCCTGRLATYRGCQFKYKEAA